MKIISNNKKDATEQTKQITCPECSSVIEYSSADITLDFWRTEGWTNSNIKYRGFPCPCCGYKLGIETLIGS